MVQSNSVSSIAPPTQLVSFPNPLALGSEAENPSSLVHSPMSDFATNRAFPIGSSEEELKNQTRFYFLNEWRKMASKVFGH